MVEDLQFQKLLQMLNSGYELPSRKTVSESLISQMYNTIQEQIQTKIHKTTSICLTTDCWTSTNNQSFMAFTVHFFTDDLHLQSVCIGCEEFDRHTSQNLATRLSKKVDEWSIHTKVVAIVSDNTPNIIRAVQDCNYHSSACFAHSVNLAVQNGINNISEVQYKVKSIVGYFKRSPHALVRQNETQKQMGMNVLKLKQDVITR